MSDDYTPSTDQVRRYWRYGGNAWADNLAHDVDSRPGTLSFNAEFDRWLAEHDAEVERRGAVKALRDAAQIVSDTAAQGGGLQTAERALLREADRIERG